MYLLVIVRFLLGLLPRTSAVAKSIGVLWESGFTPPFPLRHDARTALTHEWMRMDYVWTENSGSIARTPRGTFERANHPLRSMFRLARRLAGCPEACPAFVPTVVLHDPRLRRR